VPHIAVKTEVVAEAVVATGPIDSRLAKPGIRKTTGRRTFDCSATIDLTALFTCHMPWRARSLSRRGTSCGLFDASVTNSLKAYRIDL
jgi:hypothetical protein